jgi:acyl-CoA thioesterase FadM
MSAKLPAIHVAEITVPREWLDYNDHMNVAYYTLAFDNAGEELLKVAGMGETYTQSTNNSWMVLEGHITYQNEARLGDTLIIRSRVLDCSAKAAHLYQEMFRGEQLLSTQEQLMVHVNLETRRTAPFEPEVLAALQTMQAAQRELPRPDWIGRHIGIRRNQENS